MEIEKTLKQFGLDSKEIKVYIALLQLGKDTVLSISKKAGIKRPTAYLILESLMEKGLVSKIPRKNKTLFIAENPEKIVNILDKRKNEIAKIIPNLLSIYNIKDEKPQVQMYEGKEGVEQVYETIFKAKEIWWFGNLDIVAKELKVTFGMFEDLVNKNKIIARDLIGNSEWEKEYAENNQRHNYEIRISSLPIDIDFAIYEDKVSIISLNEDKFGLIIQDKRIADSIKSLYELAWRQAGKYKPRNKSNKK